jgi:hypothetical protein
MENVNGRSAAEFMGVSGPGVRKDLQGLKGKKADVDRSLRV